MRRLLAVTVVVAASLAALSIGYAAQSQQAPQGQSSGQSAAPAVETAGQSKHFKNIQVLKDIPADQLIPSMQFISAALGRDCSFCHVTGEHNDFASDDKPNKKTAREMMTMTMGINQNSFAGQQRVTCATCHAGHNQPNPATPIADEARIQEMADLRARQAQQRQQQQASQGQPGGSAAQQPGSGRPSPQAMQAAADEVVTKFVQAIGGDAAIQKLTSSQEKGSISAENGQSAQFEIERQAPNKVLFVSTMANGQSARVVCNGSEAAVTTGQGTQPIHGIELDALKLDANFYRNLNLKAQYTRMQSSPFPQKIDGKEVKVVQGILPNNQGRETLYFDPQSGLLVRRTTLLRTALGPIAQQTDYSDYREVNGVKIPFSVRVARADVIQTRKVTEAKFNVPVTDSTFAVPAPASGAPSGGK